jgi:TonB family protein
MLPNTTIAVTRTASILVLLFPASTVLAQLYGPAPIYGPAVAQGAGFSASATQQAEAALKTNPSDLTTRARLIGYYSAHAAQDPAARGERLNQIQWMIENQPDTFLLRHPTVILQRADFFPPYSERLQNFRHIWQDQIDRHPNDPVLIENAVRSLGRVDVFTSEARTMVDYLKRLRVLEPGDPEWALELAGTFGLGIPRGLAPGATPDAKQFAQFSRAELDKSTDAAVVGLAAGFLYESARMEPNQAVVAPMLTYCESLLRRAAALNPKNPKWLRLIDSPVPKNGAEESSAVMNSLDISDLWPGGVVAPIPVPDGGVTLPGGIDMSRVVLQYEGLPFKTDGNCSVRFEALIGTDGRVHALQVAGFEHINVPYIAQVRDALRRGRFPVQTSDGVPAAVVTNIDMKCSKEVKSISEIERSDRPVSGVAGGVRGGIAAPPPGTVIGGIIGAIPSVAPRAPQTESGQDAIRIPALTMERRLLNHPRPMYPAIAKQGRVQGTVSLDVIIAEDGKVESIKLLRGHPLLVPAAIEAVKQWVYDPMLVNGVPVRVRTQVDVNFTLSE